MTTLVPNPNLCNCDPRQYVSRRACSSGISSPTATNAGCCCNAATSDTESAGPWFPNESHSGRLHPSSGPAIAQEADWASRCCGRRGYSSFVPEFAGKGTLSQRRALLTSKCIKDI
jgi:hypothetical protein